jgi:polyhydroxyalkanoate synthesis regulator phasin
MSSRWIVVNFSPVAGVKERIEGMLTRHGELLEDVNRLDGLVEEQRRELEMQNSSRLGGIYDDDDGVVVTQAMVDEEEEKVRELEEKIKGMQEQVWPEYRYANLDCAFGWEDSLSVIFRVVIYRCQVLIVEFIQGNRRVSIRQLVPSIFHLH